MNGLEGTLVLRKPLDYETLPNFTLTIRAQVSYSFLQLSFINFTSTSIPYVILLEPYFNASFLQDQGNPPQYTDTLLYVNVIDADDQNPKFVDERYSAILPDQAPVVSIILIL